jgi:molybdate transport system permease protein
MSPDEWSAVLLTLDVALRSLVIAWPVAITAAFLLARTRFPGRALLDAVVHLPLVLPPVVVGWLLLLVFGVRGPVGRLLALFGIRLVFTTWGAALACAVMALPLMVRAMRLSLEAADPLLVGFAAALGEFGAVITFAANIPGQTQTLPLAIYTALQTPDGESTAARLSLVSVVLAVALLLLSDSASRALNRRLGR